MAAAATGQTSHRARAAGPVFFAAIVAALGFSFVNWRCPACRKYLGKGFSPKFCPKCGVVLS